MCLPEYNMVLCYYYGSYTSAMVRLVTNSIPLY